ILSKNARSVKILMEASDMGHSGLSEVAADIRKIAEESESLLEINAVMQNIATQTNLLSMNAAIEAAHAGSSGMGFAVVADEIRKLAESSSGQSKTIGLVLKQIKGSIDKITRSTDNVMTRFDAIDGGVRTVAEQEEGILNAMTEQGAGSAQIMQAIAQVNDITHQIKEDAHRIVEAAAKLVA
ncbi:MAG: methyl-accepting chemotaxis protein, partial [Treponema sp.]|nr:methyl-accepting chemotaxis protein [Treponema sp.]